MTIYVSESIAAVTVHTPINENVRTVDNIFRYTFDEFRALYPYTFEDLTEDDFNELKNNAKEVNEKVSADS